MSQLAIAAHFAEAIYQLRPSHIEPMLPLFDWRGIYRIRDAQNRVWLLRLVHQPHAVDALTQTAHLLHWLEQQHYPAPRLCVTQHYDRVGFLNGWASLLLSYIDGTVLDVHATDCMLLGHTLGQLYALPLPQKLRLPHSRCAPTTVFAHTAQQLDHGYDRVPGSIQPLVATL